MTSSTTAENIGVFYDFIEDPARAARAAREDPPVLLGFFAFLVSAFTTFLAEALTGRLGWFSVSAISMAVAVLWHLGVGFLQTSVVHMISEAGGGRGRAMSLFVMFGLSELAWALVLPGVLVLQAFLPESKWAVAALFFTISGVVSWLKIRSISLNYGFGILQAAFALVFPWLAAAAATFFLLAVATAGLFQQIVQLAK